jgi:hypothetical protein
MSVCRGLGIADLILSYLDRWSEWVQVASSGALLGSRPSPGSVVGLFVAILAGLFTITMSLALVCCQNSVVRWR